MYIGLASSVLGPEGFEAAAPRRAQADRPRRRRRRPTPARSQPFYNAGFQATDYVTAKAIFANGQGAMEVAGTADFTGYREVNPEADLGFIAWPGPEAGKYSTNTGMELLYTVSRFAAPEANQAAATTFVNWLATAEAQQLVSVSERRIIRQVGEGDLRLDHPEFGEMAARIRVFRAECRSECIHIGESEAVHLDVELPRNGQERFPPEKVPAEVDLPTSSRGRFMRSSTDTRNNAPAPSASDAVMIGVLTQTNPRS